jgi:uncharacterized protein YndB with AHSA1/START domain
MAFQKTKNQITWKVHFSSSIEKVFFALTTDEGRKNYWAEETLERSGFIEFTILNYPVYKSKILDIVKPELFSIEYFGTKVTFTLSKTTDGGTDLSLIANFKDETLCQEMTAGWVSVLLAMKAAVDFGVDLRNHNAKRSWGQGFVDN